MDIKKILPRFLTNHTDTHVNISFAFFTNVYTTVTNVYMLVTVIYLIYYNIQSFTSFYMIPKLSTFKYAQNVFLSMCSKCSSVTLIDFLPLIKRVSQFLIKGELTLKRERGTSHSLFLFLKTNVL